MKLLRAAWVLCVAISLVAGASTSTAAEATAEDYPEAHPAVGQQPRRPAGYVPYRYPKSPAALWHEETPAFLERAHAAWDQAQAVIRQGPYRGEHESIGRHPCPEWFLDAKFGMFIDWGPWSVAGWAPQAEKATYPDWYEQRLLKEYRDYHLKTWGEDVRPDDMIQLLRSKEFRADRFTQLAHDAGMRYVVPFLKHHGGYCLWDSSFTHRDSVEWGLKHDFARDLSDACRAAGLRYAAYVSLGEWNYPVIKDNELWTVDLGSGKDLGRLVPRRKLSEDTPFVSGKVPVYDYAKEYLVPSLKELIDATNPYALWFDGEWGADAAAWHSPELVAYYYNRAAARKQEVCVNDRLGTETRGKAGWGDFFTSEFHVIKGFQSHPWEENRSLSHSYGYNWEESSDDRFVLGEDESLDLLLRVVANGGNLLLMVSPDGSGHIPPNQERRLRFLGQWLDKYGEAVYATRAVGLARQPEWGYVTKGKKGDKLYLVVRKWPADGVLRVPVSGKVTAARLVGAEGRPTVKADGAALLVDLAGLDAPDPHASAIALDVEGDITPAPEAAENRGR